MRLPNFMLFTLFLFVVPMVKAEPREREALLPRIRMELSFFKMEAGALHGKTKSGRVVIVQKDSVKNPKIDGRLHFYEIRMDQLDALLK